jgi:hypothetical protein
MSLIKHLLTEITDAKNKALFDLFIKKIFNPLYDATNSQILRDPMVYDDIIILIEKMKSDAYIFAYNYFKEHYYYIIYHFTENKSLNLTYDIMDNNLKNDFKHWFDIYLKETHFLDKLPSLIKYLELYKDFIKLQYEIIIALDETTNKTYTQWILNIISTPKYVKTRGMNYGSYYIQRTFIHNLSRFTLMNINDDITIETITSVIKDMLANNRFINLLSYEYGAIIELTPLFYEDFDKLSSSISQFHLLKNKQNFPSEYKDINKFKSFEDLYSVINNFSNSILTKNYDFIAKDIKSQNISENTDYKILGEDSEWLVVNPLTENGACSFGYDSEWCTSFGRLGRTRKAKNRHSAFNTYKGEHLISFINKKNYNDTVQIHINRNEFRSYTDAPIGEDGIRKKLSGIALEIFETLIKNKRN